MVPRLLHLSAGPAEMGTQRTWGIPERLVLGPAPHLSPSLPAPKVQLEGSLCSLVPCLPALPSHVPVPLHLFWFPHETFAESNINTAVPLEMCFIKLTFLPANLQLILC